MLFLHGGANRAGSSVGGDSINPLFDGGALAARGVILVTANYRVGVFGFFTHPELTAESPHHASGNYALLDQIAALRWASRTPLHGCTAIGSRQRSGPTGGSAYGIPLKTAMPCAEGPALAGIQRWCERAGRLQQVNSSAAPRDRKAQRGTRIRSHCSYLVDISTQPSGSWCTKLAVRIANPVR
jgi:hypothetical protein